VIPAEVIEALAVVREEGKYNMLSRPNVIAEIVSKEIGGELEGAASDWLIDHEDQYATALKAMGESVRRAAGV